MREKIGKIDSMKHYNSDHPHGIERPGKLITTLDHASCLWVSGVSWGATDVTQDLEGRVPPPHVPNKSSLESGSFPESPALSGTIDISSLSSENQ